jgi:SOS-response transcriptional repressor LexA
VKTFVRRRGKVVLRPANPTMDELVYEPDTVQVYGKVVTLLRRL